jgi:hypothetical protein
MGEERERRQKKEVKLGCKKERRKEEFPCILL